MKKKIAAILLTLALLAGCQSRTPAVPAAPSTTDTQDMEAIIQQSVAEAVREKMQGYEEEQKKKDEEIARLKNQLEDLTASSDTSQEVPPEESQAEPPIPESQPLESQQEEPTPSQAEVPSQPEPEPASSQPTASPTSYDPYDLKNMYPGFVWEGIEEAEEETYTAGCLPEEAQEVIRLTNIERENHGLEPLPVDAGLIELAQIRAEEIREKYSHTRPDGTTVVDLRCGENCGQDSSAKEQIAAWMNSDGHRANILLDRYHHIGAACYRAENGNLYWVQVFSLD